MIKHIVMFRLKGEKGSDEKNENIQMLKTKLEILPATISQIVSLEVGLNISEVPSASDLVLITEFNNIRDLEEYKVHPDHKILLEYLNEVKENVTVVDYRF